MKKIILLIIAIVTFSLSSFGQAPEGFKYQAVVRDAGNTILNNQAVGMRITIQQGSIGGTTVYQETFAPTTNAYGLVNLEIGSGSVVSGTFATIDWSAGPYFMETAVDVTGGTSYAVMGTSQLMSVPYALHANTAENVINDLVDDADNDPNNEIQTIGRTGTTVTLSNGGGTFEDSVGVYTAGTGITISNNVISSTSTCGLSIGDTYEGGIIFYLDASGCHGLIAAPNDWINLTSYGPAGGTGAVRDGLGAGEFNTNLLAVAYGFSSGVVYACTFFNSTPSTIYADWVLPSVYELQIMFYNLGSGPFANFPYWSSTEVDANNAFIVDNGNASVAVKSVNYYVRPIRSF